MKIFGLVNLKTILKSKLSDQSENKNKARCSTPVTMKEMQIKTLKYDLTLCDSYHKVLE